MAEPPGTAMPSESRRCTGTSRPRRGPCGPGPHTQSPHGSPPPVGRTHPQPFAGQAAAPAPVTSRTCAWPGSSTKRASPPPAGPSRRRAHLSVRLRRRRTAPSTPAPLP
ncbi:unnamed protein product [Coccothraustes coccothraustes]